MSETPVILIVEDDDEHLRLLNYLLARRYRLLLASSAEEGLRAAREKGPDLVILDLHLPDRNGVELCEMLRTDERTATVPILLLTGDDMPDRRIAAFTKGADDFISKPFVPAELIARIEARLKRFGTVGARQAPATARVLRCGNLLLDLDRMLAKVGGSTLSLSTLEFRLLTHFVANPEKVFSREQILQAVWRKTVVAPRTVDTHVSILRRKLKSFDYSIVGLYGSGYSLRPREDSQPETRDLSREAAAG